MTTLLVDELKSTLSQVINSALQKRIQVAGVRPYLYMHNSPAGTFTLKIKDGAVVIASQDFTSTEMKSDMSTADNYIHMWKTITFDDPVQLKTQAYTLELSSSGYTFTESAYLAWVREHENETNTISGTPLSDFYNPLSNQLFGLVEAK